MGESLLRPVHGFLCMVWDHPDQQDSTHRPGRVTHLHRVEVVRAENLLKDVFDRRRATPDRDRLCRSHAVHVGHLTGSDRRNSDEDSRPLF